MTSVIKILQRRLISFFFLRERKAPLSRKKRPCHMRELFVRHDGWIFPCCLVWPDKSKAICHIGDKNILESIKSYWADCRCERFELRKSFPGENAEWERINVEYSLQCQAQCAMCCVGAPEWSGAYDYYELLEDMILRLRPREMVVQGGELLIQEKTLLSLAMIRQKLPQMKMMLISNGNHKLERMVDVEKLFDRITISIVGFQPETYNKIMGMSLDRMKNFAEQLMYRGKVEVVLKYLVTALNLHELHLFLDWALTNRPYRVTFAGSGVRNYIVFSTQDSYWKKIISRTAKDLKSLIVLRRAEIESKAIIIGLEREVADMYDINEQFIRENALEDLVVMNKV